MDPDVISLGRFLCKVVVGRTVVVETSKPVTAFVVAEVSGTSVELVLEVAEVEVLGSTGVDVVD
jgi:hypothetical protein